MHFYRRAPPRGGPCRCLRRPSLASPLDAICWWIFSPRVLHSRRPSSVCWCYAAGLADAYDVLHSRLPCHLALVRSGLGRKNAAAVSREGARAFPHLVILCNLGRPHTSHPPNCCHMSGNDIVLSVDMALIALPLSSVDARRPWVRACRRTRPRACCAACGRP